MSTMIERVARAMFSTDWPKDDWDRFGPRDNAPERYRAMARAAIAEMRVPTEAMLAARFRKLGQGGQASRVSVGHGGDDLKEAEGVGR